MTSCSSGRCARRGCGRPPIAPSAPGPAAGPDGPRGGRAGGRGGSRSGGGDLGCRPAGGRIRVGHAAHVRCGVGPPEGRDRCGRLDRCRRRVGRHPESLSGRIRSLPSRGGATSSPATVSPRSLPCATPCGWRGASMRGRCWRSSTGSPSARVSSSMCARPPSTRARSLKPQASRAQRRKPPARRPPRRRGHSPSSACRHAKPRSLPSSLSGGPTARSPTSCSSARRRRASTSPTSSTSSGVSSRIEAAMLAARAGLIAPEPADWRRATGGRD